MTGIKVLGWVRGAGSGSGGRCEETEKFRIDGVTAKFPGEICARPLARANKACRRLCVAETALSR